MRENKGFHISRADVVNALPALPKRIKLVDTKSFVDIDLDEMRVEGDAGISTFHFAEKSQRFNATMAVRFQYAFLHALNGRRKVATVSRWINEVSLFTRNCGANAPIEIITFQMFNLYAPTKNASQQKLLRSALLYWSKLGIGGIAEDLENYLTISPAPKPRKTIEIQNSVEHERPFKITEVRRILGAVDDLYINQQFDAQANLLWRLIISEALRPSQLGLLKIGDVSCSKNNFSTRNNVFLKVPIVKQSGTAARDFMFEVKLSNATSHAIRTHLKFITEYTGISPSPSSPLFCISKHHKDILAKTIDINAYIARTKRAITTAIGGMGEHDFFTRRFKHTKLTHLAILGAPLEILARAGYQTSTISLRHYTNLTDEAFLKYELQMSETHEEIYNAFSGKIIEKSKATKSGVHNIILAPDLTTDLGACATTPCGAFAPVACYTCPRFEAFTDGPHEEVLAALLKRQELTIKMDISGKSENRDAHLIAAVTSVINGIANLKK